MANRQFTSQFAYSFIVQRVDILMQVSIGGTGAPTLVSNACKGVASISRNSAGDYSITLQDKYQKVLAMQCSTTNSTGISAAPDVGIKSDAVSSTKIVRIVCSAAGVATDPASGDVLNIHMVLSNSNLNP